MAVKKTAKKTAAKKTVAKKPAAKKSVAKKVAKKSVAKKTVAKKPVAKKAASKKTAAKKTAAKKSVAKKPAAKKASAKKATAKKVAKKSTAKKITKKSTTKVAKQSSNPTSAAERIVIPAVPSKGSSVETKVSTAAAVEAKPAATSTAPVAKNSSQEKSSSRVVLAVFVGIVLLAVAVVSRNHTSSDSNKATPTESASPEASMSESASPTTSSTPEASEATATNPSPEGIVAHYTATGATIFWKAGAGATGLTNFNVEIRSNGGEWKLISTVPASQLSLDITKSSTDGWCSFRVSAVYGSTVVAGKVFGLPGQYA